MKYMMKIRICVMSAKSCVRMNAGIRIVVTCVLIKCVKIVKDLKRESVLSVKVASRSGTGNVRSVVMEDFLIARLELVWNVLGFVGLVKVRISA